MTGSIYLNSSISWKISYSNKLPWSAAIQLCRLRFEQKCKLRKKKGDLPTKSISEKPINRIYIWNVQIKNIKISTSK